MRILRPIGLAALSTALICTSAYGQSENLRGEIFCFPAEKVPKLVKNLGKVKESRRDVVDVGLMPKFLIKDGGDWPERFFIRTKSEEFDIAIEKPSGETPDFIAIAQAHPQGDVCVADKARAERHISDEGLYFEMGLAPIFHNRSGTHQLAELSEGTKDGKSFYKKMVPSALALVMPDTKYLAVRYDDFRHDAELYARVNGQDVPLKPEPFKDMHVVSLKSLKEMEASALIVSGGPYQLRPTVSVKLMKRFGWGEEAEDE